MVVNVGVDGAWRAGVDDNSSANVTRSGGDADKTFATEARGAGKDNRGLPPMMEITAST